MSFFTPDKFSPTNFLFGQSALSRAFEHENYKAVEQELLCIDNLSSLMAENHKGLKAWQYEHLPNKYLRLVIKRWLTLVMAKESLSAKPLQTSEELSDEDVRDIAYALGQDQLNTMADYNDFLKWQYSHLERMDLLNQINFNLDVFGLLLVAIDKEFGGVSASALSLNSGLGLLMTLLMIGSACLTLYRINHRNSYLEPKHYIEISFLCASIMLNLVSIISSTPILMVLGGCMSIIQSLIELVNEGIKYSDAPNNTDRKISYLQHCLELSIKILHSMVALTLAASMLSTSINIIPAMILIIILTSGLLAWNIAPDSWRIEAKKTLGLAKKYYDNDKMSAPFITTKNTSDIALPTVPLIDTHTSNPCLIKV